MTTYVALLRGINVGGKNAVPMRELRSLLASCGFSDVATYIQSGNAVFGSGRPGPEVAAELEERIEQAFGVRAAVLLRTSAELADITANNPFLAAGVGVYLRLPSGVGGTKLMVDCFERRLGTRATARNWKTVTKLLELARRSTSPG